MALVAVSGLLQACGRDRGGSHQHHDAGSGSAAPVVIVTKKHGPLGVDRVTRFNFVYGDGAAAYAKAVEASRAKTPDWAAVRDNCTAALAKDPSHFDAEYLLGTALAHLNDNAAAELHLQTAFEADYFAYADRFVADAANTSSADSIGDDFKKLASTGVWLVARRSPFKWPSKDGVQVGTSRGELYAYDRASKRYLRLTHTDHQVAGFIRAPSGSEVAIVGFDKVDHEPDTAPSIARGWLLELDPATWKPLGPRVTLPAARTIAAGYAAGDQLLVATKTDADWTTASVDRGTGKLAKVAQPPPAPRIEVGLDTGGTVLAGSDGDITSIAVGSAAIAPIESGKAARDTIAIAPNNASVAFATAVDPCAKDVLPSLYVADPKTGALRHVLTAKSRFATRWLDPTTLAYDDGDGGIRLWDVTSGHELERLDDKNGIALDVLAPAGNPCKPPPIETAGSNEDPMPSEAQRN
ncbi:MAG TPA: hypothetical protein VGG28_32630 [Kofleriaceae bacterium]|jgi:hypothetical protein